MELPVPHDLRSLLNLMREEIFSSLNCHHIGTVAEIDFSNQTLKGTIGYRKKIGDTTDLYPILIDCPFVVIGGGLGSLRMPISAGDSCIFLFNDRDIDNWYSGGGVTTPGTARKHSFADAIALVGIRNLKQVIGDYDATRVEIVYDQTKISVKDKVRIVNATEDLYSALSSLYTLLDTFFTATSAAAIEPTLGPAATTAKASLALALSSLGDILES